MYAMKLYMHMRVKNLSYCIVMFQHMCVCLYIRMLSLYAFISTKNMYVCIRNFQPNFFPHLYAPKKFATTRIFGHIFYSHLYALIKITSYQCLSAIYEVLLIRIHTYPSNAGFYTWLYTHLRI